MIYFYKTKSWESGNQEMTPEQVDLLERLTKKKNWRITRLINGYYQTEFLTSENTWKDVTRRETLEGAEAAINASIEHYKKRLQFVNGPIVVKTFK